MWMALYIPADEYIAEDWDYTDTANVRRGPEVDVSGGGRDQIVYLRVVSISHVPGGDTTITYGFDEDNEIDLADVRGPFIIHPTLPI